MLNSPDDNPSTPVGDDARWADQARWDQPPITEIPADPVGFGPAGFGAATAHESAGQPAPQEWPAGQPAPQQDWVTVPPAPAKRHTLAKVLSGVGAVLLLLVGAGGFVVFRALHSSGSAPEQVLPGDVFAFAKLDLDPSAGQKIAAARFLNKIPNLVGTFGPGKDTKRAAFDALSKDDGLPSSLSFDRDIKPWLGDRVAVAVRPGATSAGAPDVLVAAEASDTGKATAAVKSLNARYRSSGIGIATINDYVLLGQNQSVVDRAVAAAKSAKLATAADFQADMKLVGDPGISSGWVDYGKAITVLKGALGSYGAVLGGGLSGLGGLGGIGGLGGGVAAQGRAAYAVHFTSDTVEAVVKTIGKAGGNNSLKPATSMGSLPADTVSAYEIGGLGDAVASGFEALRRSGATGADAVKSYQDLATQNGFTLPDDLKTLLGTDLVFSMGPTKKGSSPQEPFGVIVKTNGPAADALLKKLKALLGDYASGLLLWTTSADTVTASDDPGYLATLTHPTGATLGASSDFINAMPDFANSVASGYMNVAAYESSAREAHADANTLKLLHSLAAFGFTTIAQPDGSTTRMRLVER